MIALNMVSIVQTTDLKTGEYLNGDNQKHELINIYAKIVNIMCDAIICGNLDITKWIL